MPALNHNGLSTGNHYKPITSYFKGEGVFLLFSYIHTQWMGCQVEHRFTNIKFLPKSHAP